MIKEQKQIVSNCLELRSEIQNEKENEPTDRRPRRPNNENESELCHKLVESICDDRLID